MNTVVENKKQSLWRLGRNEYIRFVKMKFKKSINIGSFLMSLFVTGILVFPLAILLFQLIRMYWFNPKTLSLYLTIAWALLMLCNGVSSYFNVLYIQANFKKDQQVTTLDSKAILFYQTFNIGFGFFTLILMVLIWVSTL